MFQLAHHCKNDVEFSLKILWKMSVVCVTFATTCSQSCISLETRPIKIRGILIGLVSRLVMHLRENHVSFFTVYSLTLKSLEVQYVQVILKLLLMHEGCTANTTDEK